VTDINLTQTKAEIARRRQQKIGVTHQLTQQTLARWRARERRDEAWALSLGVAISYEGLRRVG